MVNMFRYVAIFSMLFIAFGCTKSIPEPTDGGAVADHNVQDSIKVTSDTVTVDDSKWNSNEKNDAQGYDSDGRYNSSEDGFASIYFDFNNYDIQQSMQKRILHDAKRAKSVNRKIRVEGNCDEFGTDEYNYALGLKRAKAVADELSANGIDKSSIRVVSFGESKPVCSEPTEECYARNRRVDLRVER